jgi:hypothetical protein
VRDIRDKIQMLINRTCCRSNHSQLLSQIQLFLIDEVSRFKIHFDAIFNIPRCMYLTNHEEAPLKWSYVA